MLALALENSLQFIPAYPLRLTSVGEAYMARSTYYNDVAKENMTLDYFERQTTSASYASECAMA